ncbi:MAG TPA: sodium:proton antiporter [Bacteroidota bacterium]|nr:sodium:proton antiporter [Bacteroidota bacterium]
MNSALPVGPERLLLILLPFALLLLAIALLPVLNEDWWRKRSTLLVSVLAGAGILSQWLVLGEPGMIRRTFTEYGSFILFLGALYVVTGGIHIDIRGTSSPRRNTILLALGAVLANFAGTMGASMLLFRPFLRVNKGSLRGYHIVFFIFIVGNIGGLLTPLGDPPLFLGYLEGVSVAWLIRNCFLPWVVSVGLLLMLFFLIDRAHSEKTVTVTPTDTGGYEIRGLSHLVPLGAIVASLFVVNPPFLREGIMLVSAACSYFLIDKKPRQMNGFNFLPFKELAILFAGIFITMGPVLTLLEHNSGLLPFTTPGELYWASGWCSSVLDNSPTYLSFLTFLKARVADLQFGAHLSQIHQQTASGIQSAVSDSTIWKPFVHGTAGGEGGSAGGILKLMTDQPIYLRAITLGSVIFGAFTYIGNGPNFVVKSLAEHAGCRPPAFFKYIFGYALPILLPLYVVIWWIWL